MQKTPMNCEDAEGIRYRIYETEKRHLPKDLTPQEYEKRIKELIKKYRI